MNLENLTHADFPFNHWVFSNCLEEGALDEISYSNIPSGDRMYDGTRAADHTGPVSYTHLTLPTTTIV